MTISIIPKKVFFYLLRLTGILLVLNIISIIYRLNFLPSDVLTEFRMLRGVDPYIFRVVKYFDFNQEMNVPTLYSTLLLFFCAILLMIIAWKEKQEKNKNKFWTIFSMLFIFLSMDEFMQLHEVLIWPTRYILNTSGLLYFAWVIPYGVLLIVFALYSYGFLIRLPRKILKLFLFSGAVYVFGALIIEMPEGLVAEKYGYHTWPFAIFYTIEELLEMLGLNIFIYSLLLYSSFTIKNE